MFLYIYFLLGFYIFIVQYNYENWVWLGLELGASLTMQWVLGPEFSFIANQWTYFTKTQDYF